MKAYSFWKSLNHALTHRNVVLRMLLCACTSAAFAIGVPSTRRCAGMLSFVIHQWARLTQYSYCHQARSWSRDGGMGGGGGGGGDSGKQ